MKCLKFEYIDAQCPLCGNSKAQTLKLFYSKDVTRI